MHRKYKQKRQPFWAAVSNFSSAYLFTLIVSPDLQRN